MSGAARGKLGFVGTTDGDIRGGLPSSSSGMGTIGTTRNRTDVFLKYRRQARGSSKPLVAAPGTANGHETVRLMATALGAALDPEAGVAGVAAALPPQYVDFKEQIRLEMLGIKQKMAELRNLHGKAALSKFEDTGDDEVEVVTQQITKLFRKCEVRLTQFGGELAASEADEKVKRNVQRTLAVELQRLSVQFRKQQKQYLNRLRSKDGGAGAAGSSSSASLALLDDQQRGRGAADDDFDPGFSELQATKVDNMTTLIDERDREVVRIVQSINELAQIMKDLSVLVIDQGTILDRIDYNMEQTAMKVEEGVRQLEKAEKKQRQSGMALCVMALLVMIMLLLVFVVLKSLLF
ncbi:hypothetical protein N2152v2_006978 [Parachlorella kessleri]